MFICELFKQLCTHPVPTYCSFSVSYRLALSPVVAGDLKFPSSGPTQNILKFVSERLNVLCLPNLDST